MRSRRQSVHRSLRPGGGGCDYSSISGSSRPDYISTTSNLAWYRLMKYNSCRCKICISTSRSEKRMAISITRDDFLADRQGRTFVDVATGSERPFAAALEFFNDEHSQ